MSPFRMAPLRWFLVLAVVLALTAPGCKPRTETATTGGETVSPPPPTVTPVEEVDFALDSGAALDVKRVSIREEDGVIPEPRRPKVRKKQQIVIWALKGDGELKITFADSPFGDPAVQPQCSGRFCAILSPPREGTDVPPEPGEEGRFYKYKIQVIRNGQTHELDPNVEVIP